MPEKEIKTIITDLGNVVLFFDDILLKKNLFRKSRLLYEEFYERFQPEAYPYTDFVKGKMSPNIFHRELSRVLNLDVGYYDFTILWCNIFKPNKYVIDIIKRLKEKKYRIVLLSNLDFLHLRWIEECFKLNFFDEEIYSCEVLCAKPEEEIYRIALGASECKKEECVFIDDLKPNIIAARKYGLPAIQYCGDNKDLVLKFKDLGIKI